MDEVLDVLLQGLMGLQGDGQVAVVLSVAEVHLDACGHKRGTKTANQKTLVWGFPGGSGEKNPRAIQEMQCRRHGESGLFCSQFILYITL